MARTKTKCLFIIYSLIVSVSTRSLPYVRESTTVQDDAYIAFNKDTIEDTTAFTPHKDIREENLTTQEDIREENLTSLQNNTYRIEDRNDIGLNNVRPGQSVFTYNIELTRDGEQINGKAILDVRLTDQTIGNLMKFNVKGLEIHNVQVGIVTIDNLQDAIMADVNDDVLEIRPRQAQAATYIVVIEYSLSLGDDGSGIYIGQLDDEESYIAMNLHPTNARRVFPCMDEPNLLTTGLSFTFKDMGFDTILSNSELNADSTTSFRPLQGPVHRWAMVAHDMNNVINPVANLVSLYTRRGINNQDTQASVAINNYYHALNTWTGLEHSHIAVDQSSVLHVMAVPDVARDWYGLSTLCIWEPYILMENNNAVKQRKTALVTIAEGMARQWFGWVIFPENWRDQWVIAGLGSYAAYEIAKDFQTAANGQEDPSLIDMNTIFTTDVIQESLLYDAYDGVDPVRLGNNIYDENLIRLHTLGLLKKKAPALLRMTRLVLSRETDLVQTTAQGLLRSRSLQSVTTRNLYDGLSSGYGTDAGSDLIDSVEDFLRPWVENKGYPLITVELRQGGVNIIQGRFGFTALPQINYKIPLSFTTSSDPNFDDVYPSEILESNLLLDVALEDDDWIIFNIQGQGYYRVNYEAGLWWRLIEALSDEETREDIHSLNRATLLDDSLILARAGRLDYDTALGIALTMELETEYAVWKAFVRNMEFIRKRLVPFVQDDERDQDIYLRMIRRTIVAVEEEIGFEPEGVEPAMVSLTRGLVMEHVCKVGYEPCVAVAVDSFYDPNNDEEVNPNIPPEIRPAVYCTMVREDEDDDVVEALKRHLDELPSRYERLVILESFACSENDGFIQSLLSETISHESPYVVEERSKIFAAVASSSYENARRALNFLTRHTGDIRNMYGGPEKLEEMIFIMAENILDGGQATDFINWVNSQNSISNLDDSMLAAQRARDRINENLAWANNHLEAVYEWIDMNDASSVFVSTLLLCLSMCIALFNQQ